MKNIEDMNYRELCELSEEILKIKNNFINISQLKIVDGHLCYFSIDGNLTVHGERAGITYRGVFDDFVKDSTFVDDYPYFRDELYRCGISIDFMVSRKQLSELWNLYKMSLINREGSSSNKR